MDRLKELKKNAAPVDDFDVESDKGEHFSLFLNVNDRGLNDLHSCLTDSRIGGERNQ